MLWLSLREELNPAREAKGETLWGCGLAGGYGKGRGECVWGVNYLGRRKGETLWVSMREGSLT